MSLDTYTGLTAEIASWLRRSDITAEIPTCIALAEARLNRDLRCQSMITRSSGVITGSTATAPTDFGAPRRMALIGGSGPLVLRWVSSEQMDDLLDSTDHTSGPPRHYTIEGGVILFSPNPGATTYTVSLSYYATLPPLASNSTNWLLAAHPDAYLYGALLQATAYTKNDARLPIWQAAYAATVASINESDSGIGGALSPQPSVLYAGAI